MTGLRVSWERLTKFHGWRVGATRFGWSDNAGTWQWNGNFEFQAGPMRVSYVQDLPPDDYIDRIMLQRYRWYSIRAGHDFLKLGPLTLSWYRFDGRSRVSWHWFGGMERIIVGRPLASAPPLVQD